MHVVTVMVEFVCSLVISDEDRIFQYLQRIILLYPTPKAFSHIKYYANFNNEQIV